MEQRLIPARERTDKIMKLLFKKGFDPFNIGDIETLGLPANIEWAYGATRLVVWDWDYPDFVVKIPLGTDCFKYCDKEVGLYQASLVDGVDRYFAWTEFVDFYHDWPIYAMEFVDCDQDSIEDSVYTSAFENWCAETGSDMDDDDAKYEFSDYFYDEVCDFIYDWIYNQIGSLEAKALESFINVNRINDIHCQNVGFKDGQIVIVDYASFGW